MVKRYLERHGLERVVVRVADGDVPHHPEERVLSPRPRPTCSKGHGAAVTAAGALQLQSLCKIPTAAVS